MDVGPSHIAEASRLLAGVARRTPLEPVGERLGPGLSVKAEHLQRTGSFKVRGAFVRIARLQAAEGERGVVAASAGNHAQGVAWAAARLGVHATVVMPTFAALPKVEATRGYGAEVILHGDTFADALRHALGIGAERGATFVHPYDDPWIVAGQATVGAEIVAQAPGADLVVVPVGGGGLIAGVATAVKLAHPRTRVVGVRPAARPATIADGAAVDDLGVVTRSIVERLVDEIVEVDEEAIAEAMLLYLERGKQLVEGAGALPLAAVASGAVRASRRTVLVASGGNVDPGLLVRVIRHGLGVAGRYLFCRLRLRDRPGELQRVLAVVAGELANVVSIVHHRAGLTLPVDEAEVELTLETRDREHAARLIEALRAAGFRPDL